MFSDREQKIIDILKNKKLSYKDIAVKLFGVKAPLDSTILIGNSITRINKKCDFYDLDWTFRKSRVDKTLLIYKSEL